jgi:hypothetical protein
VSSPNEPGYPGPGDGPGRGNGSIAGQSGGSISGAAGEGTNDRSSGATPRSGQIADPGDVPPWQRGPAGRALQQQPHRPSPDEQTRHSSGVDARLNRFVSGSAPSGSAASAPPAPSAPESDTPPPPSTRTDSARENVRPEAYGSELPDLSGPVPRPPLRKPPAERGATEPAPGSSNRLGSAAGRVQVGNRPRGPVRASMQIRRVDPWSTLKVSLVLSVALFFVWMIAVAFLYLVLGGMGVWSKLNSNVGDLLTNTSNSELVSSGTIFGGAALIGLVNIVLMTAMATIGAFIYNVTTDLVGGVEVTLADRD